jgi:CheY-like chemotaxis protein
MTTKPLAIIFYEELLIGSQLVNRLQDLSYRVQAVLDASQLHAQVVESKPLVILCGLGEKKAGICAEIAQIRTDPSTAHIPILAFGAKKDKKLHENARAAGANLVAADEELLAQLPQLLEQILHVD